MARADADAKPSARRIPFDLSVEVTEMCLNCGCGEYEKRHKPSDITMDDLKEAAKGQGMEVRKAAINLQDAGRAIAQQGHEQEGHKLV